jgi:hypothetical protein
MVLRAVAFSRAFAALASSFAVACFVWRSSRLRRHPLRERPAQDAAGQIALDRATLRATVTIVAGTTVSAIAAVRCVRWAGAPGLNSFQLTTVWILAFTATAGTGLGLGRALWLLCKEPSRPDEKPAPHTNGGTVAEPAPQETHREESGDDLRQAWQRFWRKVDLGDVPSLDGNQYDCRERRPVRH